MNPHQQDLDPNTLERDDAVIGTAFRWSLCVILLLGVIGGSAAWVVLRSPAPERGVSNPPNVPPNVRQRPETPAIRFTDITEAAGLKFVHENGAYGDKLLPETMGGGCAFCDIDNDGDQDIVLVNSCRWPWDPRDLGKDRPTTQAVYRNDGTGRFVDATKEVGLDVSFYGMGIACGDYDNDGDVDLFFTAVGKNHLFRNDAGKFVEVSETAGVAGVDSQWSTSAGWFDYDNDGDLDLFVANYIEWTKESDLSQKFTLIGGNRGYGRPQPFRGVFPYLYRNEGNGTFRDVSAEAGVQVTHAESREPLAKGLGITFADFDADGWLDVVVANDTVQNFLLHNLGGRFEEIGAAAGVAFDLNGNARGAMGIDTAWFRNNSALGIAIGNFSNEMTALYVSRSRDLQFQDEAVSNGLGPSSRLELKFGVLFVDLDLDGRQDLVSANGHLENEINKVQSSQHYEQSPHLFWNCGPQHATEFELVSREKTGNDFARPTVGRGAAYADIDGDGDLDLLIANNGQAPKLLRNDQAFGHHWLRLQLMGGGTTNRDAIGTVVEIQCGDVVQQRMVMPTRSYLSQVELPVSFGLGPSAQVDEVRIRWPDGFSQKLQNVAANRLHKIERSDQNAAESGLR